jgi:hypothetical protein
VERLRNIDLGRSFYPGRPSKPAAIVKLVGSQTDVTKYAHSLALLRIRLRLSVEDLQWELGLQRTTSPLLNLDVGSLSVSSRNVVAIRDVFIAWVRCGLWVKVILSF